MDNLVSEWIDLCINEEKGGRKEEGRQEGRKD